MFPHIRGSMDVCQQLTVTSVDRDCESKSESEEERHPAVTTWKIQEFISSNIGFLVPVIWKVVGCPPQDRSIYRSTLRHPWQALTSPFSTHTHR